MAPRGPRDPQSLRNRLRLTLRDLVTELGGNCEVSAARQLFMDKEGKVEADYGLTANGGSAIYFTMNHAVDDHIKMGSLLKPAYKRIALNPEWVPPTPKVKATPTPKVKATPTPKVKATTATSVYNIPEVIPVPTKDGEIEAHIDPASGTRV
ncbi:MAG: hypothetical protein FJ351_01505, partial [Sphingomonadales bacterium]|nr:hypothetical protein [Sphingomonadales bacterium]